MIDEKKALDLEHKDIKETTKRIKNDIIYITIKVFLFLIICSLFFPIQKYHNKLSFYQNEEKNKQANIKTNINIKNYKEEKIKIAKKRKNNLVEYKNNSHNFLVLSPGKYCPNPNLKTIYLKRKYANKNDIYLFEKGVKLSSFSYYDQTFYTESKKEFREVKLKELGVKLNEQMGVHNLYILPYKVLKNLRRNITKNIVNKYQKINRYFNAFEYASKSSLYKNYKKMNEIFPDDYNYMLETFSFPEDKKIINKKFKDYSFNSTQKNDSWLIKPKMRSLGLGISILKNIANIKEECIITKYLINPHLIKGFKYDLRIHGLVTSVKPLKIYLYDEGLVRVASEKYDPKNIDNKFSFLTNLFLNRKNKKKFIYPKNLTNIENSNLWNLAAFRRYCKRNNINYDKLYDEFGDIFIKMVFSVRQKIINDIKTNKLSSSNFYNLIGFDIICDENMKPYLLEANRRCGLRDDNDAEKYYTHNLIADTFNLVGIRIMNKKNKSLIGDKKYKDNLEEMLEDNLCELDRPRGGYKLIFPLKNNIEKYKKFYLNNIPKEDLLLWNNLKE